MALVIQPQNKTEYPIPERAALSAQGETIVKSKLGIKPVVGLIMDATIQETHTINIIYTDINIEGGRTISDHATIQPEEFTVNCIISNDSGVIFGGGIIETEIASQEYSTEVYSYLKLLATDLQLLDLITSLGIKENMVITQLSAPKTQNDLISISFNITFVEKRFVYSEQGESRIPITEEDQKKIQKKNTKGKKPSKTIPTEEAAKTTSWLTDISSLF